jgi:hypothetical protein
MKKLPFCALTSGALFVILGIGALLLFTPRPEPFGMLFPLLWDMAMIGIGLGIVFRCEVARKAGMVWGVFCILASFAVGVAAIWWILAQRREALGTERIGFMFVTVLFGLLFAGWQFTVLRSPTALAWTKPDDAPHHPRVRHS